MGLISISRRDCIVGGAGALSALWASTSLAQAVRRHPLVAADEVLAHEAIVQAVEFKGRRAIKLELSDAAQRRALAAQAGNQSSMAIVGVPFVNGTLEVDLAAEVNGKGAPDSRGFVGLAFHVAPNLSAYEAVYLRMTNGRLATPPTPPPRVDRAIQYIAHPGFHFEASRQQAPGRYERGADVGPGNWTSLRLVIQGPSLRAYVGAAAEPALVMDDLRRGGQSGAVALWVDDGTSAFFSNLRISAA